MISRLFLAALVLAVASVLLWDRNTESFGVVSGDNFGLFVNLVIIGVGALTIIFSTQTVERDGLPAGEYYAMILFAIVGMMLMGQATDLLVIFVALEILSLSVYVLTGIRRESLPGIEGGLKYLSDGSYARANTRRSSP